MLGTQDPSRNDLWAGSPAMDLMPTHCPRCNAKYTHGKDVEVFVYPCGSWWYSVQPRWDWQLTKGTCAAPPTFLTHHVEAI